MSPVAVEVLFELLDNEFLIRDNALHHVANRNEANKMCIFEHREMTHSLRGHNGHAFLDGLVRSRKDDLR